MAPINYRNSVDRYRKYLLVMQKRPLWRATLFVTLSLLLLIILLVFALRPTLLTIAGLMNDIDTKKEIHAKLEEKVSNLQKMVQSYQRIQDKLPVLEAAIPASPNFSAWGQYIQTSASASGFTIDSLRLEKIALVGTTGLSSFDFTISGKGNYTQIHDFIAKLEMARRINWLTDTTITKNQEGALVISLKGQVFFVLN
jgi:Tfp pilus assembly protein PilO